MLPEPLFDHLSSVKPGTVILEYTCAIVEETVFDGKALVFSVFRDPADQIFLGTKCS